MSRSKKPRGRNQRATVDFGKRGFFGIGIYDPQNAVNVGGVWRSAMLMGASFIFTVGARYRYMRSDTQKTFRHLPLFFFDTLDDFLTSRPRDTKVVAVEQHEESLGLLTYAHPERAVYVMGSEEDGLPPEMLDAADQILQIPTQYDLSLNIHVAASIVMYDRLRKSTI